MRERSGISSGVEERAELEGNEQASVSAVGIVDGRDSMETADCKDAGTEDDDARKYGVLVISHGSRSAEWVRLVDEAVTAVRVPKDVPMYSSFLELVEGRLIQDGIDSLEAAGVTDIIALPLFVSSGSTHVDEISYALGVIPEPTLETDLAPFTIRGARVHFLSPIDDDPVIAELIYQNVRSISHDPSRELLLLVGHGSIHREFHKRWRHGLEQLAARIQTFGGFAQADAVMLLPNQIPAKMKLFRKRGSQELDIVVAPVFLSEGYFTKTVIPSRLEGYTYIYNGRALLPSPKISEWMERQLAPFWMPAAN
jgi:sirohydrochlorin ferrochelatase